VTREQALAAARRAYQQRLLTARNSRRRIVGTVSLASTASVLWIAPAALLDSADVSAMTVTVGVVIPFGVAGLLWALTGTRVREVDARTTHQGSEERAGRESTVWDPAAELLEEHR